MAIWSQHGTLVASTVTTVTFANNYPQLEVVNRGTGDIFVTTDGSTPTVAGNETWVVPSNSAALLTNLLAPNDPSDNTVDGATVNLISSGTPAFSVSGRASIRSV